MVSLKVTKRKNRSPPPPHVCHQQRVGIIDILPQEDHISLPGTVGGPTAKNWAIALYGIFMDPVSFSTRQKGSCPRDDVSDHAAINCIKYFT